MRMRALLEQMRNRQETFEKDRNRMLAFGCGAFAVNTVLIVGVLVFVGWVVVKLMSHSGVL